MPGRPLERLEQFAIDVILERRYGKRAALLRLLLYFLSLLYAQIVRARWWLHREGILPDHHAGVRVISIGNLTVGGTGKTPFVEQFARSLTQAGRRVAILSRGYKSVPLPLWRRLWLRLTFRSATQPPRIVSDGKALMLDSERAGDEPYMLAANLDNVVVLVDKNRVKSALFAVQRFRCDTLLLDDGYQYLPLRERFNVALIDRQAPFGNGYLLPRGTLREPRDHLSRADVIFITKCSGADLSPLKDDIRRYNRHAEILECTHHPLYLQDLHSRRRLPLSFLQNRKIGALAGIAVPESFAEGLELLGAEIVYRRFFADHHRFTMDEITYALERTTVRGGHALLTTEKDAVRLPAPPHSEIPVLLLKVEIQLLHSRESLHDCILRLCGLSSPAPFAVDTPSPSPALS